MKKGILLIAFGKPGYAYMAYNMALSIRKHSPNLHITLASDGVESYMRSGYSKLFDNIVHFTPQEAGRVKVEMDTFSPYEHTLYLDVDGCLVSDIEPFFDKLIEEGKPFNTDVHGEGGLTDVIPYAIWAKNTASWAWFELPLDARYQAIQSSITYFSKEAKPLFEMAREKYNFPRKFLSHKWGNSIPDELIFSGCLAKLGWKVGFEKRPIMFGNNIRQGLTRRNIGEQYHVLSLFGNERLVRLRYREMYDLILKLMADKEFQPYSNRDFYNHKHVA
jgi:hypothetical protein